MNNIIQFPTKRRDLQIEEELDTTQFLIDECSELTAFVLDEINLLMQDISDRGDHEHFDNFDFREAANDEAKDMFAIANLINSMYLRYYGIEHTLQDELDTLFTKISEIDRNNDIT